MSALRPYPSYRNTGLPWLGQIPAQWEVQRAKFIFKKMSRPVREEDDVITAFRDGIVTLRTNRRTEGFTFSIKEIGYQGIRKGDLVIHQMDGFAGAIGVSDSDGKSTPIYSVCVPTIPASTYFYAYLLREMAKNNFILSLAKGIRERSSDFRFDVFKELELPIPPLEEQQAIAAYLDRQTAKIDALIAKKQRLLDLLAEQRAALISQAVTKGLPQTSEVSKTSEVSAPMKDSGVAWLGQVPSHWEVEKNKHIYNEIDDRSEYGDEELLTVSHITGVTTRAEKEVNMFMAETLEGYKRCRAGDLAINTMWAWMGALGISPLDGIVSPSYNIYRFKNQKEFLPKYLDYLYRTPQHIMEIKRYSKGVWSSRLRLYPDEFLQMSTPKPPYKEQAQIVDFLDERLTRMNELASKVEAAIELQQEYRAALISSVVTGRVDVRELK